MGNNNSTFYMEDTMSLFRSKDRYQKEREESVKIYEKIEKHRLTFPEAEKESENAVPAVAEIRKKITAAMDVGKPVMKLNQELEVALRKVNGPVHNYRVIEADLKSDLEKVTSSFISDQAEAWQERLKNPSERIFHIVAPEHNMEGQKINDMTTALSNSEGIGNYQDKLSEARRKLLGLNNLSIPLIEIFIQETEVALSQIDLEPKLTEMDEKRANEIISGLAPTKTKSSEGYLLADGHYSRGDI